MEDGNKRHSEGFRNVHSQQEEDEWGWILSEHKRE
jgi:hypothetical protein